jgi:multisubunit Na+/H+ antiporter MnhG subunit
MARDYDDSPKLTGLDGTFANTNIVILVLFGLCCNPISLILGIVGLVACKDPKARQNAMIVTIIGAIMVAISAILNFAGLLAGAR